MAGSRGRLALRISGRSKVGPQKSWEVGLAGGWRWTLKTGGIWEVGPTNRRREVGSPATHPSLDMPCVAPQRQCGLHQHCLTFFVRIGQDRFCYMVHMCCLILQRRLQWGIYTNVHCAVIEPTG